jgi:hypothetical protein
VGLSRTLGQGTFACSLIRFSWGGGGGGDNKFGNGAKRKKFVILSILGPETNARGRAYCGRRVPEVQQAEVSANHRGQEQNPAQEVQRREKEEKNRGRHLLISSFLSVFFFLRKKS